MPSNPLGKTVAVTVLGVFVVAVLLWGYLISQQLLLSVVIAVAGAVAGGLVYVAFRHLGGSGGDGTESQA